MPTNEEIIAAFPGYATMDPNAIQADFAATRGQGKGPSDGGDTGGGGYNQISAPDLAKLREQVYGIINPYYEELAKQAKGYWDTAVKLMTTDYQQGTRQVAERFAYTKKYGEGDLKSTLDSLGLTFGAENEQLIDRLNKIGMAVYQQGPGLTPNVVTPGTFNPTYDPNSYAYNVGMMASPTEGLGRGGFELSRLRQDQQLRTEAVMRSKMQPLEQAGLTYKQYTNPTGFDPNQPSSFTGDRSQLGTAETGLIGKYDVETQRYRDTAQELANRRSGQINQLASTFGGLGIRQIGSELQSRLLKEQQQDFLKGGIV